MASGSTVIRLLQFTDPHLFADDGGTLRGVNTDQSLRKVVELARSQHWPPDGILATGDLVQDDSRGAYQRFIDVFTPLGVPVHCLPGNHDVPQLMVEMLNSPPFQTLGTVVLGEWLVVMLDSTRPGSASGHLSAAELARLQSALDEHPTHHALICLHHHPVASGSRWLDTVGLENPQHFFKIVHRQSSVRAVLWGHVHQSYDRPANGVRLIATPSTCAQFLPNSATFALDTAPPAYRWLHLHADGSMETGVESLPQ